jgi:UPF0755 protein
MRLSRGSKWFLGGTVLMLAGIAGGLFWIDENVFVDTVEAGQPVTYTVERGASVRAVGDDLAELGVVRSAVRFRLAADDAGLAARLQPGVFELETGMEIDRAIDVLAAGPIAPPTIRFTVQEGLTVEETLGRLAAQFEAYDEDDFRTVLTDRLAAGENQLGELELPDWVPEPGETEASIIEPFEGLLWPQTYEVGDEATPLEVLQTMVDQLEREFAAIPDDQIAAAEARGLSLYGALTMASLIERETRVDAERGTVAGVIDNRLEEGMRLQIDASVIYAIPDHDGNLSLDDLEYESPYNTYVSDGLPPTPISGVGTAALRAAFDPEDVPYRFYVLSPECDGSHVFSETLDEHNVNVQAFRDAGRCA